MVNWVPYLFLCILLFATLALGIAFLCEIELLLLSRSALSLLVDNHWVKVFLTLVKDLIIDLAFLGTK